MRGGMATPGTPAKGKRKRGRVIVAIALIAVVVVVVAVLFEVPVTKETTTGALPQQSNGQEGQGYAWTGLNLTQGGSVTIAWHDSDPSGRVFVVAYAGACWLGPSSAPLPCDTASFVGTACTSSGSLVGTTSGTCDFHASPGPYWFTTWVTAGFQSGDEVDYTATVTGTLL